jgi:exopolysaccharide/PEP-CTERM locus tyrosine autokinase
MGKFTKAFEKSTSPEESSVAPAESRKRAGPEHEAAGTASFPQTAGWDTRLKLSTDPHSPYFENFRRLRSSILYPSRGPRPKTIMVTSVAPNEGKGFICANLGVALSQDMEHHALMIDCDFRRPNLGNLFGVSNETGLVDYLQDYVDLSYLIRKSGQQKLSLIPSGRPPRNPSELLSSTRMAAVLEEVAGRYQDRVVLVDSPPDIVASETGILARHLDGIILVVRHGVSKKEHVRKLVDALGPQKIMGVVYNGYPQNLFGQLLDRKIGYSYSYNY